MEESKLSTEASLLITVAECLLLWKLTKEVGTITSQWPAIWNLTWSSPRNICKEREREISICKDWLYQPELPPLKCFNYTLYMDELLISQALFVSNLFHQVQSGYKQNIYQSHSSNFWNKVLNMLNSPTALQYRIYLHTRFLGKTTR